MPAGLGWNPDIISESGLHYVHSRSRSGHRPALAQGLTGLQGEGPGLLCGLLPAGHWCEREQRLTSFLHPLCKVVMV